MKGVIIKRSKYMKSRKILAILLSITAMLFLTVLVTTQVGQTHHFFTLESAI